MGLFIDCGMIDCDGFIGGKGGKGLLTLGLVAVFSWARFRGGLSLVWMLGRNSEGVFLVFLPQGV